MANKLHSKNGFSGSKTGINNLPFLFLLIVSSFLSCQKDISLFEIDNLSPENTISVIGHGGLGVRSRYPMNSIASMQKALEAGADGIEIDVQLTKDNVLIAYHDEDLSHDTDCKGKVDQLNWNEMECRYKSIIFSDYNVLAVYELFEQLNKYKDRIYTFDCKFFSNNNNDTAYLNRYIEAIYEVTQTYGIKNVLVEAPVEKFLIQFKEKHPEYKLFIDAETFEQSLKIATNLNLDGISIHDDNVTAEQVNRAHANNIAITLWSVGSEKDNIQAIKKSPDYIQTDALKHLVSVFK